MKCLHSASKKAGYVDMPRLDTIRKDQRCQDEVKDGISNLSDDKLSFAAGAVRQGARNNPEKEKRNAAHRGSKTQLNR